MSRSSELGAVAYEVESTWGESVNTYTKRMPTLERVDVSGLTQAMVESGRITEYKQGGTKQIPGVQGGSFKLKLHLYGHGSATDGAVTIDDVAEYLGNVFNIGAVKSADNGTTATGGTANAPTTTASGTFESGALCRIGSLGDSRGDGQAYAIASHTTTTLTLLTNCAGAPNNADVIYSGDMIYSAEMPDTSEQVQSWRFILQTANLQYSCHGCFPMSVSFSGLNAGEIPTIDIKMGVSWFTARNATFPNAVALPTFNPAPCAGGSVFFNTVGTATRSTLTVRDFKLDYTLGVKPLLSPNSSNAYQNIVGAVRTRDQIKVSFAIDAGNASTTPTYDAMWLANDAKHLLYTLNSANGKSVAMYFPNLLWTGNRPTQVDLDSVNRVQCEFMAHAAQSGATDLLRSAFRMLMS